MTVGDLGIGDVATLPWPKHQPKVMCIGHTSTDVVLVRISGPCVGKAHRYSPLNPVCDVVKMVVMLQQQEGDDEDRS